MSRVHLSPAYSEPEPRRQRKHPKGRCAGVYLLDEHEHAVQLADRLREQGFSARVHERRTSIDGILVWWHAVTARVKATTTTATTTTATEAV